MALTIYLCWEQNVRELYAFDLHTILNVCCKFPITHNLARVLGFFPLESYPHIKWLINHYSKTNILIFTQQWFVLPACLVRLIDHYLPPTGRVSVGPAPCMWPACHWNSKFKSLKVDLEFKSLSAI